MNFKRCWTNYNKNKLNRKSKGTNKKARESKTNFDVSSEKLQDQQLTIYSNEFKNHAANKLAMESERSSSSLKNIYKHVSFTEVSG
jgi:hypothetical protein